MARLGTLGFCLSVLGVVACDTPADSPGELDAGTGVSDRDAARDAARDSARDAAPDARLPGTPPKVGDAYEGGTVTSVTGSGSYGCTTVVVERPAEWACTAAQVDAIRKGLPTASDVFIPKDGKAGLQPVDDCSTLSASRRALLRRNLLGSLEGQLQQRLEACSPSRRSIYFDKSGLVRGSCFPTQDAGAPIDPPAADPNDGAEQISTTNTQHADVDEADFVKNDTGYAYVLSNAGLHVIDAWPAAESHQVAQLALAGEPTRLFLADDKLVVYSRIASPYRVSPSQAAFCTHGSNCRSQAEPGATALQVFDVSAPATPRELVRYELSGGYVASRRVGSVVHTVVTDWPHYDLPGLDATVNGSTLEQVGASYRAKVLEVTGAVAALGDSYFLPRLTVRDAQQVTTYPECVSGLRAGMGVDASFTSLLSFELGALGTPRREVIAAHAGFVYASSEALYIASDGYDPESGGPASSLHKFRLEGTGPRYVGSTTVPGYVLNQFSMDERSSVLRLATSGERAGGSRVITVGERDGGLVKLGEVGGIAPGETIRSVRFVGERGYLVTFLQTDPLFAVDLADPTQPRLLGELKIPGFSTYMHPLDASHLLGLGVDGTDWGAQSGSLQLQIFDVSDPSSPKQKHKTTLNALGASNMSEALINHLAFHYFAPKGVLALPLDSCTSQDPTGFRGLVLFDVSLEQGIHERGRMPFVSTQGQGCWENWTQSRSTVKRSIFLDDFVVGISDDRYQVAALASPGEVLKSIPLGN